MSTHMLRAAAVVVGSVGLTQVCQGQARRLVTVEYENALLNLVVRGLGTSARRTIVLAPEAGNPDITVAFQSASRRERG